MGLGIAGTLTEIGRIKKADMKGLDDLIVGLLLTVVSVVVILKFRNVALNIGLFIVLLLGSYGMIRGILEILYSLKLQRRKSNNVKIEIHFINSCDFTTCKGISIDKQVNLYLQFVKNLL